MLIVQIQLYHIELKKITYHVYIIYFNWLHITNLFHYLFFLPLFNTG